MSADLAARSPRAMVDGWRRAALSGLQAEALDQQSLDGGFGRRIGGRVVAGNEALADALVGETEWAAGVDVDDLAGGRFFEGAVGAGRHVGDADHVRIRDVV